MLWGIVTFVTLFVLAFGFLLHSHIQNRSYIDCLLTNLNEQKLSYQQARQQLDEQQILLELYASRIDSFRVQLAQLENLSEQVLDVLAQTGTVEPEVILTQGYMFPDWGYTKNIGGGVGQRVNLHDWITDDIEWIQAQLEVRETTLERLLDESVAYRELLDRTPSLWPVVGWISSTYGWRTHPITGKRHLHSGIDIAAAAGTKVRATARGKVTLAGEYGGYGLTVIIDHGTGISTLYAHNQQLFVSQGQMVEKGDIIAAVGSTGVSTGPHLHYEVRLNGEPVNPYPYLP